ncbi:MAG: amino acid permease [Clostridiales Family XIII bacterium]|jgi:amino acid transporter|nr:amino acid permease [Clostridiales Family XIII bacterium]
MGSDAFERNVLKRTMGNIDVLAFGFGTMIGWGWVMLAGGWVENGGTVGAMIAFAIGAVLCIFVGITYAELTPMLPLSGGELVFAYRGFGYTGSWITGWMITFAYIGVAAFEGPSFATAVNYLVEIPKIGFLWTIAGFDVYVSWMLVGVIMSVILTILNYIGIKSATVFQTVASALIIIGGLVLVFGSVTSGSAENMEPLVTSGRGILTVMIVVPAMFVGFDVIPQAAEEMSIPLKNISKILIISIIMAAIWYIAMIFGLGMSAPEEVRLAADIPVPDALAYSMGHWAFGKIMICAALLGIVTSWNGFIIGGSRVLFAMARAKMIPEVFGKVHPKYGTPSFSVIFIGVIVCLAVFLGRSALVWLIDASAFGTVVAYFMVALSFLLIRRKEPELKRPYKAPAGPFVGIVAVAVALFFLWTYLPMGPAGLIPVEWAIVLVWVALGVVFFIWAKNRYKDVDASEYEYLMFGPDYSRKHILDSKKSA